MNALINALLDQIGNLVDSDDRPSAAETGVAVRKLAGERNMSVQLEEFLSWFDDDDQGDPEANDAA